MKKFDKSERVCVCAGKLCYLSIRGRLLARWAVSRLGGCRVDSRWTMTAASVSTAMRISLHMEVLFSVNIAR